MSTSEIVALVAAILVVTALVEVAFIRWLRRLLARNKARMAADLSMAPAIRGPERAAYRGSIGGYSKVSATGLIALTQRTLVFRKVTGGNVDVPLAEISGVRLAKQFNRRRLGGPLLLVVQTLSGEVVYQVSDPDGWRQAIARVCDAVPP